MGHIIWAEFVIFKEKIRKFITSVNFRIFTNSPYNHFYNYSRRKNYSVRVSSVTGPPSDLLFQSKWNYQFCKRETEMNHEIFRVLNILLHVHKYTLLAWLTKIWISNNSKWSIDYYNSWFWIVVAIEIGEFFSLTNIIF